MMKVIVWLPRQIDCAARFLSENAVTTCTRSSSRRQQLEGADRLPCHDDHATAKEKAASTISCYYLTLRVQPSRVLWNSLRPLLFEAPQSISRRVLFCILSECFTEENAASSSYNNNKRCCCKHGNQQLNQKTADTAADQTICVAGRSVTEVFDIQQRIINRIPQPRNAFFRSRGTPRNNEKSPVVIVVLWIQPPHTVPLEYLFTSLLIRWEHRLIQAQSMAGYMATLGGGFFLCHHFATAMFLANQQQRLAVLLNDETMYYACAIHKAYSCIYSGRFRMARQLLRQVHRIVTCKNNVVIERMCRSALLFGKRMRQQSKLLTASPSQQTGITASSDANGTASIDVLLPQQGSSMVAMNKRNNRSTTFDDFVRVRVVRDKSKKDDLVIPFSKACGK